jgi:hypothetical protein
MVDFCSAENPFRPVASPEEAGTLGVFQRFSGEIECPKCVTFHLAGYHTQSKILFESMRYKKAADDEPEAASDRTF